MVRRQHPARTSSRTSISGQAVVAPSDQLECVAFVSSVEPLSPEQPSRHSKTRSAPLVPRIANQE
jgi:hypothetical protein